MVRGHAISHSPKLGGGLWYLAAGAALGVGGLAIALRRHGLELSDEGVLLAHIDRVAHGQVPYRDFHVGYGPALYYVEAWLFGAFGGSTDTVRGSLAIVHALRAAALAGIAAAVGGRLAAVVAVIVLAGFFLPVAPGLCAPANIPYPAWFADVIGLGAMLVLCRARGTAGAGAAGVLWGVAFLFKQNAGLLGLGAGALTVVLAARDATGSRILAGLLAGAFAGAALALVHAHLAPTTGLALLAPLVPLAIATAGARIAARTAAELAVLAAGFAIVAGGGVAGMVAIAGWDAVQRDLLQIGTDTAAVYFVPYPTPAWLGAEVGGVGWVATARIVADTAWFLILPAVHLAASVLVARGRLPSRLAIGVAVLASVGYLAVYPRADFWHLLPLAVPSLCALTLVASRLPPPWRGAVATALVVASVVRFLPTIPVLRALATPAADGRAATVERLDVRFDLVRDERLALLPAVVAALGGRSRVAGFPALGIVNFARGTPSPWRHDYFFPGRPDAAEEDALAREIVARPPDAVVVLDTPAGALAEAFAAHPQIVGALEARFVESGRIGPYRILLPRESE